MPTTIFQYLTITIFNVHMVINIEVQLRIDFPLKKKALVVVNNTKKSFFFCFEEAINIPEHSELTVFMYSATNAHYIK